MKSDKPDTEKKEIIKNLLGNQAKSYIEEMEKGKSLAIFGSRILNDNEEVKCIIKEKIKEKNIKEIVTAGEIGGVGETARRVIKEKSLCLKLFYPDREKFAQGCYSMRSILLAYYSDEILIIWDGESKGTKNEIEMCKKMNLEYDLVIIKSKAEEIIYELF